MYVPLDVTFIEGVVSVVDQTKFVPVAVNVELPQSSTTVTTGADGIAVGRIADVISCGDTIATGSSKTFSI